MNNWNSFGELEATTGATARTATRTAARTATGATTRVVIVVR